MKKGMTILLCCLISCVFAIVLVSPSVVDPNNTDWVINGGGDYLQHYLGWRYFREAPWSRQFLFMRNLNYPVGTSVIVTDSNPLFCLIFKGLSPLLSADFQFNGIWLVFSYTLLGLFACLCAWKMTADPVFSFLTVGWVLVNPVILQRAMIHDTLTAHWLILAAFWLLLERRQKWNAFGWGILVCLTMLIHAYFMPMIAWVLALQLLFDLQDHRRAVDIIIPVFVFLLAFIGSYVFFGYRYIEGQSGSYGELSLNLNAFLDPDGTSLFLKDRVHFPLQYEGFNYWGLGLLILFPFPLCLLPRVGWKRLTVAFFPLILLILLAAGNEGTFDLISLWSIELPERLQTFLSVFRSSGRLVWPLYYAAVLTALYSLRNRKLLGLCVMAALMILQWADLNPCVQDVFTRFRLPVNTLPEVDASFDSLSEGKQALFVSDGASKEIDAFALYAVEHHMRFNRGTNARGIKPIYDGEMADLSSLTCDNISSDSIYVFMDPNDLPESCEGCTETIGSYSVLRSADR